MATHQIVILADADTPEGGSMAEIGSRESVVSELEACNTGPDFEGSDILYGPGFSIELAPEQDPISQMLLTIDDEDIAWVVIMRLARKFCWKLLDPMSGRELRLH